MNVYSPHDVETTEGLLTADAKVAYTRAMAKKKEAEAEIGQLKPMILDVLEEHVSDLWEAEHDESLSPDLREFHDISKEEKAKLRAMLMGSQEHGEDIPTATFYVRQFKSLSVEDVLAAVKEVYGVKGLKEVEKKAGAISEPKYTPVLRVA